VQAQQHPFGRRNVSIQDSRIAIAVSLALAAAQAQAQQATEEAQTLSKISVQATEPEETPKVDRVSSPKFTQDLLDTPQTISVVSKEVLQQQGATSLSQALRNTPGVTFLLGENGNTSTGDSIFMRGFDTQGSIFIDGIRDLGTVTRDTFNTEQVEIAKGPAGPDNGRSAASGYVNMATKVPGTESFSAGSASYGTANNGRITGDLNHRFEGSGTALRLNVMGQDGDVDGRDFIERQGWAVAPSLAFGLEGDTRAYFYLLHTEQDNIPDGGVPTIGVEGFYNPAFDSGGPHAGQTPARVDRDNYYGFASDFEEIKGTMFTARFEHDFNDDVTLRNTSRYGKLHQFYVLTGVNTLLPPDLQSADPDQWTVPRTRQSKFQDNTLLTNQTNVTANLQTGSVGHAISGGIEFIDEEQYTPTYLAASLGTPIPPANLYAPDRNDLLPGYAPVRDGRYTRGETQTAGVYVFDTVSFAEKWQATAGFRVDHYETDLDSVVFSTQLTHPTLPVNTLVPQNFTVEDDLFSYKVGLVFKPVENGSIYLSHATSQQPPGGSNFTFSTNANNQNNPALDPHRGFEPRARRQVGIPRWRARGHRCPLRQFQQERDRAGPGRSDPVRADRRARGAGHRARHRRQTHRQLGAERRRREDGHRDQARPRQPGWPADHLVTGIHVHQLDHLAYAVRPLDRRRCALRRQRDPPGDEQRRRAAAQPDQHAHRADYWVLDLMASYAINDNLTLQLNGYNLTDELYVATLNNSGARYMPGSPRSALLTVNFTF
jgi:catecholate siderophore receptor